jgi:arylsulfatase A-like enzyme
VRAFLRNRLDPKVPTLAEILSSEGYRSILCSDALPLFTAPDLVRGFHQVIRGDETLRKLISKPGNAPWFLFIHFFDVHAPYGLCRDPANGDENSDFLRSLDDLQSRVASPMPGPGEKTSPVARYWRLVRGVAPQPEARRLQFDLYVRGARKFDRGRFRRVLSTLRQNGLLDNGFLALFSDHGEGFSVLDPFLKHGRSLSEEETRVVLMVRTADASGGRRTSTPVCLVDLFSTVLKAAGLSRRLDDLQASADGMDLLPALSGGVLPQRLVYQETWRVDTSCFPEEEKCADVQRAEWHAKAPTVLCQRAVRSDRHKLIVTGDEPRDFWRKARGLNAEEFLRLCYRSLLGRPEDPEGFQKHLAKLPRGELGRLRRWSLYFKFRRSTEMRSCPTVQWFDYIRDPLSSRPLSLWSFALRPWASRLRKGLEEISRTEALETPRIEVGEEESASVGRLLADAGYLEPMG